MKMTKEDAIRKSGWHSDCMNSPKPRLEGTKYLNIDEAKSMGYRKGKKGNEFVLVASCRKNGFQGSADATYLSVWSK